MQVHTFASLHKIFGIFLWYQLHACALLAAAPKEDKTLDTTDKRMKKGVNETDTRLGIIFLRQLDVFIIGIIKAFLIEQSVTKFPDYYTSTLTIWPCHNFHRTAILWKLSTHVMFSHKLKGQIKATLFIYNWMHLINWSPASVTSAIKAEVLGTLLIWSIQVFVNTMYCSNCSNNFSRVDQQIQSKVTPCNT